MNVQHEVAPNPMRGIGKAVALLVGMFVLLGVVLGGAALYRSQTQRVSSLTYNLTGCPMPSRYDKWLGPPACRTDFSRTVRGACLGIDKFDLTLINGRSTESRRIDCDVLG